MGPKFSRGNASTPTPLLKTRCRTLWQMPSATRIKKKSPRISRFNSARRWQQFQTFSWNTKPNEVKCIRAHLNFQRLAKSILHIRQNPRLIMHLRTWGFLVEGQHGRAQGLKHFVLYWTIRVCQFAAGACIFGGAGHEPACHFRLRPRRWTGPGAKSSRVNDAPASVRSSHWRSSLGAF